MNATIYINGVQRRCTGIDATFYADADTHPGVRCSCHNIGDKAAYALKHGQAVKTLGNVYSLSPGIPKFEDERQ